MAEKRKSLADQAYEIIKNNITTHIVQNSNPNIRQKKYRYKIRIRTHSKNNQTKDNSQNNINNNFLIR